MPVLQAAKDYLRFAANARRFVRDTVTPAQGRAEIQRRLAGRDQTFLSILEDDVYGRPDGAYAKLLKHAGVELDDARRLIEQTGVEGALQRFYDAGVYMTGEEQKGRQPIRRGALEIEVKPSDFGSGASLRDRLHFIQSSGSSGSPSQVPIDFRSVYDSSMRLAATLDAHGLLGRPAACMGTSRPSTLWFAKTGRAAEKYFSPTSASSWFDAKSLDVILTKLTVSGVQLARRRFVNPELSKQDEIVRAAEWLAEKRSRGTPGLLWSFASPGVRVCNAASERGLDISGSTLLLSGEPFTQGKAAALAAAGARAIVMYAAVETGVMSHSCATPTEPDDMHLFTDKVAAIQRPREVAPGVSVDALVITTIALIGRRLLINAESGDYATLETRDCGCALSEIGLTTHLSGLRSYEKLTSEGVTFIGSNLHDLLEQVLPARFGGGTTDYQLVEEEDEAGLPRVSILVAPRVGPIDEAALIDALMQSLKTPDPDTGLWMQIWSQGKTLRVIRREPYKTSTAKVLPLHILRPEGPTPISGK